jgi:SNF2 family DNA or RNA helicase
MLTGTPMLNSVTELWPLLHRIDPPRFSKYWSFVNQYCVFGGYENRQIIGVKNQKELTALLGEYQLRRRKKDVLDLPPVQKIQVLVGLTDLQQKLYDSVEEMLELPGPNDHVDGSEVSNALTKFLRLKQICGTPYAIDPEYEDSSLKLDRCIEIISEQAARDEKVIVYTQFRGVLAAIMTRAAKTGHDALFELHGGVPTGERQDLVKRWASVSGSSVIVCNTTVAGVGLNMTAARVGVFVDKLFVPGLNDQAVDRMHRIGQGTQPVQVYELLAKGTVEDRIERILRTKMKLIGNVVEGGVGMRNLLALLKQEMGK